MSFSGAGAGGYTSGGMPGTRQHATMRRPMRSAVPTTIKPPDQGNAPLMGTATGLATGGGATLGPNSDAAWGNVLIDPGAANLAIGATGTIPLSFPAAIPAGGITVMAEWATLTQGTVGNVVTVTWTATRVIGAGETLILSYEWTVST